MRNLGKMINKISIWIAGMICTFVGLLIMVFVSIGSPGMSMDTFISWQIPFIIIGTIMYGGIPWIIYSFIVHLAYKKKGLTLAAATFAACLIFQLVIISIFTGDKKKPDVIDTNMPIVKGGNQVGGFAALDEKWIFVSLYYGDKGMIYKMSTDGKEKVKLCNDYTEYLILSEGWIYYSNSSDGGKIYKMKTDGTEKTKLTDEYGSYINVSGDWIYYLNYQGIYKLKTDGTNLTRIAKGEECFDITLSGDWTYYKRSAGAACAYLYRVNINGKNDTKLSDEYIGEYIIDGEYIYYSSSGYYSSPGKFFCSMKIDGSERRILADNTSSNISISGEWMYYKSYSDGERLYKTKRDGSETVMLTDYVVSFPSKSIQKVNYISRDWIYFVSSGLYKVKTDGTELTKLTDDNVTWFMSVVGDWVYYFNDDEKRLYKIRMDGTGRTESPATYEKTEISPNEST